jgi:Homeodomain-like domain
MRAGKSLSVSSDDIRRLEALIQDRNTPQKHVWRAEIVLLTADGVGTNAVMRRTGKSKTCVWRWQERFLEEGFDGLLRDKTRPSRIKPRNVGCVVARKEAHQARDILAGARPRHRNTSDPFGHQFSRLICPKKLTPNLVVVS